MVIGCCDALLGIVDCLSELINGTSLEIWIGAVDVNTDAVSVSIQLLRQGYWVCLDVMTDTLDVPFDSTVNLGIFKDRRRDREKCIIVALACPATAS